MSYLGDARRRSPKGEGAEGRPTIPTFQVQNQNIAHAGIAHRHPSKASNCSVQQLSVLLESNPVY